MTRTWILPAGIFLLLFAWFGPLPQLATSSFAAHMGLHLLLVAGAAPLIAIGLAGTRVDFALAGLGLLNPILASVAELIVVWAWHTPLLFGMSHANVAVLILEQASFVGVGFFLWLSATSQAGDSDKRAAVGIVGLLLTSMHMALLGTLLNLAPRPLYPLHIESGALADQQLGGLLMLVVGGTVYLIGGLWLLVRLLRPHVSLSPGNRKAAASNR